jgi:16S rRNA (guanine966-N2)-methyltransferase
MIANRGSGQGYALASKAGKDGEPSARRGKSRAAAQKKPAAGRSLVRIIAGRWRGRRLSFPAIPGLRPSPDRVRETLFNWLQGPIVEARCLDLFAGSGVLGFEALSRGASEAVLVERDGEAVKALQASAEALGAPRPAIVAADAFAFLKGPARPFDVVFLDPPFAAGWLPELCTLLEERGWLAPRARVYLESAASEPAVPLPAAWEMLRETRAGEVRAVLARRRDALASPAGDGAESR